LLVAYAICSIDMTFVLGFLLGLLLLALPVAQIYFVGADPEVATTGLIEMYLWTNAFALCGVFWVRLSHPIFFNLV